MWSLFPSVFIIHTFTRSAYISNVYCIIFRPETNHYLTAHAPTAWKLNTWKNQRVNTDNCVTLKSDNGSIYSVIESNDT